MAQFGLRVAPWLAFLVFLTWMWGVRDLTRTLPSYGDAMETVVTSTWFAEAVVAGQNPFVYPLNYFPEGWHIVSHSAGVILSILVGPAGHLMGAALAYNLALLFSFILAFAGTLLLAGRRLGRFAATVVALAFTFWGLRWHQADGGRFQVLAGSALLPWMLWGVERAFADRRRRFRWLTFAAGMWCLAFATTLYFVFIGGVAVVVWILLARADGAITRRERVIALGFTTLVFLLFSAPWLYANVRASQAADAVYQHIDEANGSASSLNSLVAPFLFHPRLASLARWLYRGAPWEQNVANFGLAGTLAALIGAWLAWRRSLWRPVVTLAGVGVILALGLTLHWNGEAVQWRALRPLNQGLWWLGHLLKPHIFVSPQPPPPFAEGVPLPGYLPYLFIPFWDRGRMLTRYTLAGGLGVFLLMGLTLALARPRWLQVVIAGILLFELIPPKLDNVPYPPEPHPAFLWLRERPLKDEGVMDVYAGHPSALVLAINGETLLATRYHRQPAIGGSAGVVPKHTVVLNYWLATHEHPFWQPDFAPILRSYRVKYILLAMMGAWEQTLWEEAKVAPDVIPRDCFPPPAGRGPWNWPICIIEVPPAPIDDGNLLLHEGWSGREAWGVWAEGTESHAQWVATAHRPYRLEFTVFPQCLPGRFQQLSVEINGASMVSHQWQNCDPWTASVPIHAQDVRIGFNDLIFRSAYALPPPGSSGDTRKLSVGFSALRLQVVAGP